MSESHPSAQHFMAHSLLLHLVVAVAIGAFGAVGQAPYNQPAALILALAFGFVLWRLQPTQRRAAIVGWAFGLGYFAHALVWILEPFQVDAARHGWMAPFALLFLSGGLALFWGGAFWLARRLSLSASVLVLTWTGAEVARAYIFTGFPWASPAQAMIEGPVSRLLAAFGPHGATLIIMGLAWALSLAPGVAQHWRVRGGQAALLAGALLAFYLPLVAAPVPLTNHVLRLVQPNAEQHLKWRPENAERFFSRQLELTAAPPLDPERAPDLIVWPETAIPWRLGTARPALLAISDASNGVPVALGLLRFEGDTLRNALAVLDAAGEPRQIYDKHHLVPFGEYIPFSDFAERIGLRGLVVQTSGFSAGSGPELLDFGPLGKAMPLICYEVVFAHEVGDAPERPAFLLQVTNDAWFGTSAGPQQHLAQARMRAIEQGLPLARSANTGISAMIDPYGRVTAQIGLGRADFVDAGLPAALPHTLYSRTGDTPVVVVLLFGLFIVFLRRLIKPARHSD